MSALVLPRSPRSRPGHLWTAIALVAAMALGAACGSPAAGPQPASAPAATPSAAATAEATAAAPSSGAAAIAQSTAVAPGGPAPTPDPRQQAFGLHAPLPLAGEYAVTANLDDHTLSVVPIGAAAVAATVPLDLAPRAVGAAPNSDTVIAADGSPSAHAVAIASLNASTESGTLDVGSPPDVIAAPPPNGPTGPLLVVSDTDDTIRSVDPTTRALGAPQPLGAGPHTVYVSAARGSTFPPQIYVSNAGDGTLTVLDQRATT
ncbi:MAG TPA: hypothetical protein VK898_03060, partial [Chloroflexota bacterium]|nr:hypothetical protein [Chloroflexota bacterium]